MLKKGKKILCTMLVVVMCLTSAPLDGFIGIEWPEWDFDFTVSAAETTATNGTDEIGLLWNSDGTGVTITGYNPTKDGTLFYGIQYNGHYYGLSEKTKTWAEAKADCEANGGHLVTITSEEEQKIIQKLLSYYNPTNVWIGATDEENEGEWVWCTGEEFYYSNWISSQPDNYNSNEHYININNAQYKWNDWNASQSIKYVCEWEELPPDGVFSEYKFYGLEYNGHYYGLSQNKLSWEDAKTRCEDVGGQLVCINTEDEQDLVEKLLKFAPSGNRWIGAYKADGLWQWVDGDVLGYDNWYPGEPNGNADSACIYCGNGNDKDFHWDDASGTLYYICEWTEQPSDDYFKLCSPDIVIPEEINYLPVSAIGNSAFANNKAVSSVEIPDSIITIGDYAFNNCSGLTKITINANNGLSLLENNGHYYAAFDKNMSWDNARVFCENYGGHLVTITNSNEQNFVQPMVAKIGRSCWLGGSDYYTEGDWNWITGEEWNYTNWNAGEPNNGWYTGRQQDYNAMYINGTWDDGYNTDANPFICEWESLNDFKDFEPKILTKDDSYINTFNSIGANAFAGCVALESVYYTGTEDEWKEISIASGNDALLNATIYFEHTHVLIEWITIHNPTCKSEGREESVCQICGGTAIRSVPALEHSYSEWIIEKEASIFNEGIKYRTCSKCGNIEKEKIEKLQIDIEENTDYGLANFIVVNAQTLKPIKGASIFVSTDTDGECTFYTDEKGEVSIILPVGEQTISAYADGCLVRNLKIEIEHGVNDIAQIGLSDKKAYDVNLNHHLMTYEEIKEAGIDPDAVGNKHVYKYELKLEFTAEIDWVSIFYQIDDEDPILGEIKPGNGFVWTPISGSPGDPGVYYHPKLDITIYPSERFYLIIQGEVQWLKEMFDVEMLIVNNSMTDTLENLTATLMLPEGLSLADMYDYTQTETQKIDKISECGYESVHWYVRGDDAGEYGLEARLQGMVMPFKEEFDEIFVAEDSIHVWAGDALNLHFEFPDATYYGEDYPIKITLTNVSDITLYNLSHKITYIEQSRVTYYEDGSSETKIFQTETGSDWYAFIDKFKPGDKLVFELDINILFESEVVKAQIQQMLGAVDEAEKFFNLFKLAMTAIDLASFAIDSIGVGCSIMADAVDYAELAGLSVDALSMMKDIYSGLSEINDVIVSGEVSFDAIAQYEASGLKEVFEEIAKDPIAWVIDVNTVDMSEILHTVNAVKNSIKSLIGGIESRKFNVFDSIRNLINALPIRFTLQKVIFSDDFAGNTTKIPWSYSVTERGIKYFGVTNMMSHIGNLGTAIILELFDAVAPSYFNLIPGIDDMTGYNRIKQEIKAVDRQLELFKVKDATGEITFTAYYIENPNPIMRTMSVGENYILECTNETAEYVDGKLTFTGDGILSFTAQGTQGGTLYIEDSEGNVYTYDINVVEQHECIEDEPLVILRPTAEHDGYAVKCCAVCQEVMDAVVLSATECKEHNFGEWYTVSDATCCSYGYAERTCSVCQYTDSKLTEIGEHSKVTVNKADATCTTAGHTGDIVCEYCNTVFVTGSVINAVGHSMTEAIIKNATCIENGAKKYSCIVCGYNETKEIIATGHNYVDGICTLCGDNKTQDCSCKCHKTGFITKLIWKFTNFFNKLLKRNQVCECGAIHYGTIDNKVEHTHSYIREETISPTCVTDGLSTYLCGCGESYTEVIPASHAMVIDEGKTVALTCTSDGVSVMVCSLCGYSEMAVLASKGHIMNNGVCSVCGYSKIAECDCKCHDTGILSKLVWKISVLLNKFLRKNQVCPCGINHY